MKDEDQFSLFNEDEIRRHNESAWDKRARQKLRFTRPAPKSEYLKASEMLASGSWLSTGVKGKKLLNLASGGGGQCGLFASLGAEVTVVDISDEMLDNDRKLAKENNFNINVVRTSMDDLSMLTAGYFDIVIHPVSTCYLPNIKVVFEQVARVCKPGAIYISHHKQPISMQVSDKPVNGYYLVKEPYDRKGPLPPVSGCMHREEGTLEFLHSWEDILGGLCRSGFFIDDYTQPSHGDITAETGSFEHRSCFVPPFLSIKAIRRSDQHQPDIIIC